MGIQGKGPCNALIKKEIFEKQKCKIDGYNGLGCRRFILNLIYRKRQCSNNKLNKELKVANEYKKNLKIGNNRSPQSSPGSK